MPTVFSDYFRCPDLFPEPGISGPLSNDPGFFRFGDGVTCHGRFAGATPSRTLTEHLIDASLNISNESAALALPFDLAEVVGNLRNERYLSNDPSPRKRFTDRRGIRRAYYFLRPLLPVAVRKHLQRIHVRGWKSIHFPNWPVDFTLDALMEQVLALVLKSQDVTRIPFIWFWPEGAPACAIMTHDVEGITGRNFCGQLMDFDDSFEIKSSFQLVPEVRYGMRNGFLHALRSRGFEINVHDLNHDGSLFHEREKFLRWAPKINEYAREFGAQGFRSGAMYRNQDWFDAFDFSYDMSVPNVARLEPQRGGCCTVMPYFIGKILELPLTTTEDYSLFHILGLYSTELWEQQINLILQRHGLITFITHPDYLIEKRPQRVYLDLLSRLSRLRAEKKLWVALPGSVNRWWRNRHEMRLVRDGNQWRIVGPDSERARIAYASLDGDRLVYSFDAVLNHVST